MIDATKDVTILAYHFWNDASYCEEFQKIKHAFLEAWKFCGRLKSVLVVNKVEQCVGEFAAENSNLQIQQEDSLRPGNIYSLSCDCNSRLHTRFDTQYVLTIQNDGYPLRNGFAEFVGKWDFIGAPHIRDRWYLRILSEILDCHPMNGGFSLRSHECCEQVAYWWNSKYSHLGDCLSASEDIFTTDFLPRHERSFKKAMKFPSVAECLGFSYQKLDGAGYKRSELPFGFHKYESLNELSQKFHCKSTYDNLHNKY